LAWSINGDYTHMAGQPCAWLDMEAALRQRLPPIPAGSVAEVAAAVAARQEAEEGVRQTLIDEEMWRMYKQRPGRVCSAEHRCQRHTCELVQLQAHVYTTGRHVHVCLRGEGLMCPFDDAFHAEHCVHPGSWSRVTSRVYACAKSPTAHICTPESCKGNRASVEGQLVCELTGNVMGIDPQSTSYSWAQDAIDQGRMLPARRERAPKRPRAVQDPVLAAVGTLVGYAPRVATTADQPVLGAHERSELAAARVCLVWALAEQMVQLLPGSATRRQHDGDTAARLAGQCATAVIRELKAARAAGIPVALDRVWHCAVNASGGSALATTARAYHALDADSAHRCAIVCADQAVTLLVMLAAHTSFGCSGVHPADYATGVMYLLRDGYRERGVEVVEPNWVLAMLLVPTEALDRLLGRKVPYTQTRRQLSNALREAAGKAQPAELQLCHVNRLLNESTEPT
jgi:hypothetical protein